MTPVCQGTCQSSAYRGVALPQVFQVQKKDTGQVYAMKVMRKERVIAKDHGEYVRAERNVLTAVFHPYIVTLRCSFQVNELFLAIMIARCKFLSLIAIMGSLRHHLGSAVCRLAANCIWCWTSSMAATSSSSCIDRYAADACII